MKKKKDMHPGEMFNKFHAKKKSHDTKKKQPKPTKVGKPKKGKKKVSEFAPVASAIKNTQYKKKKGKPTKKKGSNMPGDMSC